MVESRRFIKTRDRPRFTTISPHIDQFLQSLKRGLSLVFYERRSSCAAAGKEGKLAPVQKWLESTKPLNGYAQHVRDLAEPVADIFGIVGDDQISASTLERG